MIFIASGINSINMLLYVAISSHSSFVNKTIKMKTQKEREKMKYVSPKMEIFQVEFEQSIAAGSANINTGSDSGSANQTPTEREWESGWSNNKDFDL